MPFLRQSTSQVILFGPCLDKTDGVTEETALTLAQADMRLSKDGGAFAQKSAAGNATHDSDGWYNTTLSTTDTATVGELVFNVHQPANMLPIWLRYWVLEEAIYDALFGASAAGFDSNQRVDVGSWIGTAVTLGSGAPDVNIASTDNIALSAQQKLDVNTEVDTALNTAIPGGPAANSVNQRVLAIDDLTQASGGGDLAAILLDTAEIGTAGAGLTSIAEVIFDEDMTAHQGQGTFGQAIGDPGADADTIYGAVVTGAAGANVAVDIIAVKAETALIVADTNELQTDDVPTLIAAVQSDTDNIQTRLPAALVSGRMNSDAVAISGDTTAADNLELQYDTTGLTGGTFPASQDQVGAIGTSGGAALNFAAADDNVDGALNGVTFVGVQTSGTFVSTEAEEGTNHVIDDTTNNIDILYQFNIGGGRTGTEVIWKGYLSNNGDSVNIQMFDFVGSDWETRAIITGKNQAVNETIDFPILSKHTGTGANIGIVYIRFVVASATNPTLETDELIVEAVNIGTSVGYLNGAVAIDTVNGVAGTEIDVNGVWDNPVLTLADAITIAAAKNLTRFQVIIGSTITFAEAHTSEVWIGDNWTLALENQDISNIYVSGATISGIGTGSGVQTLFNCHLNACTWPTGTHLLSCEFEDTQTLGAAGEYDFDNCTHGTTSGIPTVDFGAALNSSTLHMHPYHGGLEIQNMGAGTGTYLLHINGDGLLTFNANCSATSTVNIAGSWDITNNAAGLTINEDARYAVDQINKEADTALSDYDGPTKAEMDTAHALLATPAQVATELGTYDGPTKAEMDTAHALLATPAQVNTEVDNAFTTQMADSVPADGAISTREQALYIIQHMLTEFAISGTTMTVKKVDGSTTLMTFTLDDDTNPTSLTRAT